MNTGEAVFVEFNQYIVLVNFAGVLTIKTAIIYGVSTAAFTILEILIMWHLSIFFVYLTSSVKVFSLLKNEVIC